MKQHTFLTILTSFVFVVLVLFSAKPTFATSPTFFEGFVAQQTSVGDFFPVDGATIDADCNHGGIHTHKTGVSDAFGSYSIQFDQSECANGDHVVATAHKANWVGTADGDVFDGFGGAFIIMLEQTAAVPEFGVITGSIAAMLAAGYMLSMRRHATKKA